MYLSPSRAPVVPDGGVRRVLARAGPGRMENRRFNAPVNGRTSKKRRRPLKSGRRKPHRRNSCMQSDLWGGLGHKGRRSHVALFRGASG